MRVGDKVRHRMHGVGEIVSVSKSGVWFIVKYPLVNSNGFYYRTHSNLTIEKVED